MIVMAYFQIGLPSKVLEKDRTELLELYKRCIKTYLTQRGMKFSVVNKFFRLMDLYIRQQNIEDWFYIPVWLTVQSIVKGDEAIAKLFKHQVPKNYVHKHCKKPVRRKKQD
nr:MAG TPA: hypothetical protein [Caudoviricetes sp.]